MMNWLKNDLDVFLIGDIDYRLINNNLDNKAEERMIYDN